jgi:hypothetical protein
MGTVNLLKLAKAGALSAKQKGTRKKRLVGRKKELTASMKDVDQGLKMLGGKAKKRRAKR